MASKRSRATYEADLQAQQSPYVFYGTPLPPRDGKIRDDGSYVPVWKQDVTDERGRKRLHGAFTGGFSAGYFNTVGSKEGWAPSTFVSSRAKRQQASAQKAEDFMDDEDLREAEDARKVETSAQFSGLGGTADEVDKKATIMDLLRPAGESVGTKLLKRMGWREGQGIGPKVRRKARDEEGDDEGEETHLFAPVDVPMVTLSRKTDQKGLGFGGQSKLTSTQARNDSDEEADGLFKSVMPKKKKSAVQGGIGGGILNDTGSDDDDPYAIGPKLTYNRVMGGDKKKKKKEKSESNSNANPLLKSKPVFVSKRKGGSTRRCYDGRPPLAGFVLAIRVPDLGKSYPLPEVPADWQPTVSHSGQETEDYQSVGDLAKASTHDPATRGKLLGEAQLAGKSVFAYLTPSARDKLANLTSKTSLPQAGSESLALTKLIPEDPVSLIPPLDPQVALSALGRGTKGFVPYADSLEKQSRYRDFLSYRGGISSEPPPFDDQVHASQDEWVHELEEFAHAAAMFRPMGGGMAAKFAAASGANAASGESAAGVNEAENPIPDAASEAQTAARLSMYGALTRTQAPFYPTRLLCKRFNVPAPAHADAAPAAASGSGSAGPASTAGTSTGDTGTGLGKAGSKFVSKGFQLDENSNPVSNPAEPEQQGKGKDKDKALLNDARMATLLREAGYEAAAAGWGDTKKNAMQETRGAEGEGGREGIDTPEQGTTAKNDYVNPDRNDALEQDRAGDALFRAVFGDSDDE